MAPRRSIRISNGLAQRSSEAQKTVSDADQDITTNKRKSRPTRKNGITKKPKTSPAKTNATQNNTAQDAVVSAPDNIWSTPQTPKRNKTPAADDIMSIADNMNLVLTPLPPPRLDRPVDPHRTNAMLVTPRGSSMVAYPSTEDISPSKTGLPRPIATTGDLLEKALDHLVATDPRLKPVISKHQCQIFSPEGLAEHVDPFESLISSIIGQQVSGAAARSIKNKFLTLFSGNDDNSSNNNNDILTSRPALPITKQRFPTPAQVANLDLPTLRTAGLSQRKAEYIQGLAEKFASGELSTQKLLKATDEEVMEMLISVRGLGRWSVEMFSVFALKRTDVFSTGDLGVQRGCAAFIGKDVNKLKTKGGGKFKYMAEKDMLDLAEKFRPYRSLFMWYMWRIEDVDITVMN